MSELVSYMFISFDGYIADAGGGLEWTPIDDELMRFANEVFSGVDGIVFGRNVYEGFVEYWDRCRATRHRGRGVRRDLPGARPDRRVEHARRRQGLRHPGRHRRGRSPPSKSRQVVTCCSSADPRCGRRLAGLG